MSEKVWLDGDILSRMLHLHEDDTLELTDPITKRTYRIEVVSKPLPPLSTDERTLVGLIKSRPNRMMNDCELSEHGCNVMHVMAFKRIVRMSASGWVLCN